MIICDTSGLLAAYDQQEPDGPTVRALLDGETGTLIVSPFVLAELDYMLLSRAGVQAELTLLKDLADDVYQVATFTAQDAGRVARLAEHDLLLFTLNAYLEAVGGNASVTVRFAERKDRASALGPAYRHGRSVGAADHGN